MDNLRLILLVLGVVVVAAIWAFDAWRRRRNAAARDDPFADFDSDELAIDELPPWDEQADTPDEAAVVRQAAEPAQGRGRREPKPRDLFEQPIEADDDDGPPLGDLSPLVTKPEDARASAERDTRLSPDVRAASGASRADRPRSAAADQPASDTRRVAPSGDVADDLPAGDDTDGDPEESLDAEREISAGGKTRQAPPKPVAPSATVVSLPIMARPGRRFVGHQVRAALESVGLRYGEMQIFHYHDDDEDDTPLFSAVNALKPGTFDLARLGELSTTGVALFMQVPGPGDTSRVFELMLDTARHLAERLGGDLGDAARRPLSAARLQELRAIAAADDTP